MEGSANIALPFSMLSRGVFVRPYCNTDSGLCLSRSWTSSKPRPTGCLRIVGVNFSLPPRGRGTAAGFPETSLPSFGGSRVSGGRSLRDFGICACFILHALSFSLAFARQCELCRRQIRRRLAASPHWREPKISPAWSGEHRSPLLFTLRSRISSRSDFIHRRWISSVGGGVHPPPTGFHCAQAPISPSAKSADEASQDPHRRILHLP